MEKIVIDNEKGEIKIDDDKTVPLYSPEGFKIISDIWLKVGWDQKHMYTFSWLGRPIIQIPDDMVRMQEVIYSIKPDLIIETGIAHGGSLIYYASICKAMNKGRVLGVDIEIRAHNRKAIESHELFGMITLIEGSSIASETLRRVEACIKKEDRTILVILDSAHTYDHVLAEIKAYSKYVSVGSYIVVTDGLQEKLSTTARAKKDYSQVCSTWKTNNPKKAAEDFVLDNKNFKMVEPAFPFNESNLDFRITDWPSAFLKRIK